MSRQHPYRLLAIAIPAAILSVTLANRLWADKATTPSLGGADRYLAYVSTDKPIYRLGEKVYIRAVILRADNRQPLKSDQQAQALIEIRGPKGDVVAGGQAPSQDSVAAFAWPIPAAQPGGEYTVKVSFPFNGYPPAERKFDIRAYRAPRLKTQIVFLRDGYGPGDEVRATLHAERAEGGLPANAKVTATARVDGAEVFTGPATIDAAGNCTVNFKLPTDIARGEGTLSLAIQDGGVVETAAKTIPILMQTVDLQLYPEGGDLVAGLSARVYFEARTPAKKPADIAGVVVDPAGREVATFRTEHEGRGRFTFIPAKDTAYTLKITEPSGIKATFPLPAVKDTGAIIYSEADVFPAGEPVRLHVANVPAGGLTITLSKREVEVASFKLHEIISKAPPVILTPPESADGILVATVWDHTGKPLAERLVYRQPAHALRVTVTPEPQAHEPEAPARDNRPNEPEAPARDSASVSPAKATYTPGDKVNLTLCTTDEHGQPVSALVGLTATDDTVLEMIEKREQAPRLPVMVLLESDVHELADAQVYLDPQNPKAPLALDLLLGTQGWRRFAFVDPNPFLATHGDAARRVLANLVPLPPTGMAIGGGGAFGGFRDKNGIAVDERKAQPAAPMMPAPEAAAKPAKAAEPADGEMAADAQVDALADRPLLAKEEAEAEKDKNVAGGLAAGRRNRRLGLDQALRNDLLPVRIYAHELRPNRQPADRIDFAETLYWNAGVRTDAKTGKATVAFALSDAVTTFRVFADAFSDAGALGQAATAVESVQPFYIEPKLPLEVTTGDVILLPISLVNGLSQPLSDIRLTAKGHKELSIADASPITLNPKGRARALLNVSVGPQNGAADFIIEAKAGPHTDKVTRPLSVRPLGFPVEVAFGGLIDEQQAFTHTVNIPKTLVQRSLVATVAIYPTPLANMTEALQALIREPNGCFEQTSSSCYPLVMAQQYFTSHTGVDPALIAKSREMLDKGYARLTSFECKAKGYEWFGADPGHEALTAYGLLEFVDMSRVRTVDPQMLDRTRAWLLQRRDGKGGFNLDAKALDSFGRAPANTTAAYITWALLEAGEKGLEPEIAALAKTAATTPDTYIIALAANVMALANDDAGAKKFRDVLASKQSNTGAIDNAKTSITCSGGEALTIEATSLAVLAWLRDPAYAAQVEKAVHFLADSCKAGRYGSTQSTVLALRAIIAYDRARAHPKAPGTVQLVVDGRPAGDPVAFGTTAQSAINLPDVSEILSSSGDHKIELKMTGGSNMPYAVSVRYYSTQPNSAPECKVGLKVSLANAALDEGAVTEANVEIINRTKDVVPTPVAIIGLPGGLEPRHDQLKELVKSGQVAAYEVIGREVVLYWRALKPEQQVRFPISLIAAVPGQYTAPASRAYLYYTDEFKTWTNPLKTQIRPKGNP